MFTEGFLKEIESAFQIQMERVKNKRQEVEECLASCSQDEAEALKCLYASMPVSDAADYPASLYLGYARHGVFLWEKGPFAGKIPEKIFAGYVLSHRVNNEDLTDCRNFFYEKLKDRVSGDDMQASILAVNYWCGSEGTYRTTDGRTMGPETMMRSAYGRCGEESTFAVTALRSVGIPARQVYVPLWSHCDDNHAWVEAWCDGTWKFLGACEPEEVLNKGWFTNASSRAMMVHSRWFLPTAPDDDIVGRSGMSQVVNHLGIYAHTTKVEVLVTDESGNPVPDAEVNFEVLNYGMFGKIATVRTGEDGRRTLETGLGSVHVTAEADGAYGELLIDTQDVKSCTVVLKKEAAVTGQWEEMILRAPKDAPINRCVLTEEQIQNGKKHLADAVAHRQKKEENFYDKELADKALEGFSGEERERLDEIMRQAKGNQKEIADFLILDSRGEWPADWKLKVLNSLREKDYLDITCSILEEQCRMTAQYKDQFGEEILVPYLLCPRVGNEMIRSHREYLNTRFTQEEKEAMRSNPASVWKMAQETLKADPNLEYGNLITSAKGALESGYGSTLTQKIVSVQILRAIGVPARLNPVDGILEQCTAGGFIPLETRKDESAGRSAAIIVNRQEGQIWTYFHNWTIARFDGKAYVTLQLAEDENGEEVYGEIPVMPGQYRVLTANRLPNGNIFAKELVFLLKDGEKKELNLELKEAELSDMLEDNDITDFALRTEDGAECRVSELVKDKKGLFIWLEESKEPTEHILNEIYQRQEAYRELPANLYFIIHDSGVKEDPTLKRTAATVPNAKFLLDDFGADMEVVARRMYLEPGKLPLIVIIDETMTGIYAVAGYNVGTADMILKLLNMQK